MFLSKLACNNSRNIKISNLSKEMRNMSVVKNRAITIADIQCRCGGYAKNQSGDIKHFVESRKIMLKNVPH